MESKQVGALIVVAGMKRSGTTWMFNVIRLALPHFQTSHSLDEIPDGDVILKSHRWRADVAARATLVFSSFRDPDEARASLERFGKQESWGKLWNHYEHWDRCSEYRMDYERLVSDPVQVVAEILDVLGSDADPRRIADEVAVLEPPSKGVDPVTLYHANHFTSR